MALLPLIKPHQRTWLFKVTRKTSLMPECDLSQLTRFLGTPGTTMCKRQFSLSAFHQFRLSGFHQLLVFYMTMFLL